jgi:hypothetical protein
LQDFRHAVEKSAFLRLLEAGPGRAPRQLVGLHGRVKSKKLRFKIPVVGSLMPQLVGRVDHGLPVEADGFIAVIIQRVDDGEQGRRSVKAGQRMVARVHDFRAVLHGVHDPADFVSVGVVAVVVNQQIGIFLQNSLYQFADAPGRA